MKSRRLHNERNWALEEAADICRKAAGRFDQGFGSRHSEEDKNLAKAMALWLEAEIRRQVTPYQPEAS